jgi:dihydrofolate synthase/folylpolyglutamate synthase
VNTDLTGPYQQKNIITALEACTRLHHTGFTISPEALFAGFSAVKKNTGLRGRWEVLKKNPTVIADVAHNQAGLAYTVNELKKRGLKLHFVLGFVREKDLQEILRLFPTNANYYFCQPAIPRGLPAIELSEQAARFGLRGTIFPSVKAAFTAALHAASADEWVYVGGSTFVVAEVL